MPRERHGAPKSRRKSETKRADMGGNPPGIDRSWFRRGARPASRRGSDQIWELSMRTMIAAILIAGFCSAAAIAGELPSQCSDRNALNGISVDARLVAIKYYFAGL